MKTLDQNQKWSTGLKDHLLREDNRTTRPRIGDDDGISNKAMNAVIILFMLLTVGFTVAIGAPNDEVKYRIILRQAMLDMDRFEYDKALVKLLEVKANTEENANVDHLLGKCYLYGNVSYEKAAFYLNRAVANVSADHEEWVLEEQSAPLETYFLLGIAYEQTEHFDLAAEFYGQFLMTCVQSGKVDASSRTFAIISRAADNCRLAAAEQTFKFNENIVLNN